MKQYIKGNKHLIVDKVNDNTVIFSFNNGKCVTDYFKPAREYNSFLNYMLDVWFNVKRGNHV